MPRMHLERQFFMRHSAHVRLRERGSRSMLLCPCKTQENLMERELFTLIRRMLRRLGKRRRSRRFAFTDATIVEVYCWAVICDRPVSWGCKPANWPKGLRRGRLPSQSQVSRRMRTPHVQALLARLEQRLVRDGRVPTLAYAIDGKPLLVAGHSLDKQAGYGRAAGGKGKGYKLHAIIDLRGVVWSWRVAPMNTDERDIGQRMLRDLPNPGYLLGDRNYDSNPLHTEARRHGIQLVAPRRYGPEKNLGHRPHDPARLRCRDLLENTVSPFGRELHTQRKRVEYFFAHLCSGACSLSCLPSWVRSHRRVRDWVRVKLILRQLKADQRTFTGQTCPIGA